jgi:hypothetical protein
MTTRPASGLPLASLGVATSESVPPTVTVTEFGARVTDATGSGDGIATVTAAESCLLPLEARMKRLPAARPRTTPAPLTVATLELLLAHETEFGGRLLDMSTEALSSMLSPTSTEASFG